MPRGAAASKVTTKASVAKKLMKKNILANQKVTFGDEGEVVEDTATQKKSQEGLEYEREEAGYSGIDLAKAKAVLKAEDKAFDRKKERERIREMHKEKRRKEKEAKNRRRKEQEEGGQDEEEESEEEVVRIFYD